MWKRKQWGGAGWGCIKADPEAGGGVDPNPGDTGEPQRVPAGVAGSFPSCSPLDLAPD